MFRRTRQGIASYFIFIITFLSACNPVSENVSAQIYNPIKWSYSVNKLENNEAELIFKAKIQKGWHLYSQFLSRDDGPIATSFNFETSTKYELIGKVAEGKAITEYDSNFDMDLNYFKDKATFKQKIKLLSDVPFEIKGYLTFQVCDEKMCLPPEDKDFVFKIDNAKADQSKVEEKVPLVNEVNVAEKVSDSSVFITNDTVAKENISAETKIEAAKETKEEDKSLWGILIAGFLGGLLALMTPCVFPMIPLTVSFFTKQSKTKAKGLSNAIIYGLSIIGIYVLLGYGITSILGADALNELAANPWFNLAFFVLLLVFAISFLGAFEITLPSSWVNKVDSASDRGGLIGIFFMAFTLSLVSFSCTGPIIGTLLVEAAVNGGVAGPLAGMFGFSLALALPFALFAAFPGWLNSLPKSGGWLNSVKVVLGLLELALALKFLSNADFVWEWHIITREIFLALWIIIFALLGFYLLGKLSFSHDSPIPFISIPRVMLAIVSFAFVIYMIPGMFGAPLKLISAFPPPDFYSEGWKIGSGSASVVPSQEKLEAVKAGAEPDHCPHNLPCFHDYNQALEYAKKIGKPLMVDFTGKTCVNCRKMENNAWVDPVAMEMLKNDYVIVSLYVDDNKKLPESEQYTSPVTGKNIKTYGNKWSDFQISKYIRNSQPWYVLLDAHEKELTNAMGYDSDYDKFVKFLQNGKKEFEKRKK